MSEAATLRPLQAVAPPQPLICRLRHKQVVRRGKSVANRGEVELENHSAAAVEIAYSMTALAGNNSTDLTATTRLYLLQPPAVTDYNDTNSSCTTNTSSYCKFDL